MRLLLTGILLACAAAAVAAPPSTLSGTAGSDQVVVSGAVPDNATKAAVLQKLRSLYGAERVVDRLEVGGVVSPANWSRFVTRMIGPELKQVSNGQLSVHGNTIRLDGNVPNEAVRQQVLSKLSQAFNSHYGITQSLRIAQSGQTALDETLANRTVQFETGSAVLTPQGKDILDQMAATIRKLDSPFIQIVGHTDNVGERMKNILLSVDRAQAVKDYLVGKGIPAKDLTVSGQGPDNPVASNETAAGRARNRRIDFRISK